MHVKQTKTKNKYFGRPQCLIESNTQTDMRTQVHTYACTHARTRTHTQTYTLSHSFSLSLSLIPLTRSFAHTLSLSHTRTDPCARPPTCTYIYIQTHSRERACTHTHTDTQVKTTNKRFRQPQMIQTIHLSTQSTAQVMVYAQYESHNLQSLVNTIKFSQSPLAKYEDIQLIANTTNSSQ